MKTKRIITIIYAAILIVLMFSVATYAWFSNLLENKYSNINTGNIKHIAYGYDKDAELITVIKNTTDITDDDLTDPNRSKYNLPLFQRTNWSAGTCDTAYIEVKNTGSLDMEYYITFSSSTIFSLQANSQNDFDVIGSFWFKFEEITDSVFGTYSGSLANYSADVKNRPNSALETSTGSTNMSLISKVAKYGVINYNESNRFYRLDYGLSQTSTSVDFADKTVELHVGIEAKQVGAFENPDGLGRLLYVSNQDDMDLARDTGLPGDTIVLLSNINYDGDLIFNRRLNFRADGYTLTVSGNLMYDFVSVGKLVIDLTFGGKIRVAGDRFNFIINTPKTQVEIKGANSTGTNIEVGQNFQIAADNSDGSAGCYLNNVVITGINAANSIPKNIALRSNTRLTIGANVTVGTVSAVVGASNISIVNNGTISQILLQSMNMLPQTTYPQIYINNQHRINGSPSIWLPAASTPFEVNGTVYSGNTLIIQGVSSNELTVSGSVSFLNENIIKELDLNPVVQIQNSDLELRVYLRRTDARIQDLLVTYFTDKGYTGTELNTQITNITKLEIVCNTEISMTDADFTYLRTILTNLKSLDLSNAYYAASGTSENVIPASALYGKTTLTELVLPKNVSQIGASAFYNCPIDTVVIPASLSSSTSIGNNAFNGTGTNYTKYVFFDSVTVVNYTTTTPFGTLGATTGARFFVPYSSLAAYTTQYDRGTTPTTLYGNVFRTAQRSADKNYFVASLGEGNYELVYYTGAAVTNSITVGEGIVLNGSIVNITQIGAHAFRSIPTTSLDFVVNFAASVNKVDRYAFYQRNMSEINFNNVISVGEYAFYNCTYLTKIDFNNVISVGQYAFYTCTKLAEINFGKVETIDTYAFYQCTALTSVDLVNVITINNSVFYNCTALTSIKIYKATFIGSYAFRQINSQSEIFFYMTSIPAGMFVSNWQYHSSLSYLQRRIYVLPSVVDIYKNATNIGAAASVYAYDENADYRKYGSQIVNGIELGQYVIKNETIGASSGVEIVCCNIANTTASSVIGSVTEGSVTSDVIAIGRDAFRNNTFTAGSSLVMPDSVQRLGAIAFYSAANQFSINLNNVSDIQVNSISAAGYLTAINFGNKLDTIPAGMLTGYTALLSVDFGAVTTIKSGTSSGAGTFYNCNRLTELDFKNVKVIENSYAFSTCTGLISIDFKGVTSIGTYTFYSCSALQGTRLPDSTIGPLKLDSVQTISAYAFIYCSALKEVVMPNVTSIANYVFYGCSALTTINLESVTSIGSYTFYGCTVLESVDLRSVTSMGSNAFQNCTTLKDINIASLTSIPASAFIGCSSLEKVIIYNGNTSIGANAFENCGKLVTIACYKSGSTTELETDNLTSVLSFGNSSFLNCASLNSIKLTAVTTTLGTYVFQGCTGLVIADLSTATGITTLNSYMFDGCTSLTNVSFSNTITQLGGSATVSYVFRNCTSLVTINLNRITLVYAYSFYGCSNLKTVIGLERVTTFGAATTSTYTFTNCTSLEEANVSGISSITTLNPYIFMGCTSLKTVTLSTVTTIIGTYAFSGCTALEVFDFLNVTTINDRAFENCTSLNRINTPKVLTINAYAFYNCSALTYLNLKVTTGIAYIYGSAFANCTSLVKVDIGTTGNLYLVALAFDNCPELREINFQRTTAPTGSASNWLNSNNPKRRIYVPTDAAVTAFKASTYMANDVNYIYAAGSKILTDGILTGETADIKDYDYGDTFITIYFGAYTVRDYPGGTEIISCNVSNLPAGYILPNALGGKNVVSFARDSFRLCTFPANYDLVMPANATNIGQNAFTGLNSIISLDLANILIVGDEAFMDCSNIVTAVFSNVTTIGNSAFKNCFALTAENLISLKPIDLINVTLMGAEAFAFCRSLVAVSLYNLNTISQSAFSGCTYLSSVSFGNALIIGDGAFLNCTNLYTLNLNYIKDIGVSAFSGCTSLTNVDFRNVETIRSRAFYGCSLLAKLDAPNVIEVQGYAFYGCSSMISITLPKATTLGGGTYMDYTFANCINLKTVYFGALTYVLGALPNRTFNGSSAITSVTLDVTNSTILSVLVDINVGVPASIPVWVPSTAYDYYKGTPKRWSGGLVTKYDSVIIDGNNTYTLNKIGTAYCEIKSYTGNLSDITIPDEIDGLKVYSIAAGAFNNTTLTSITLPQYLTLLSSGAFNGCTNLKAINVSALNTSFTSLDGVLYSNDMKVLIKYPSAKTGLEFVIDNTVTTIMSGAFSGCLSLQKITFGTSVSAIGEHSFDNCFNLSELVFLSSQPPMLTAGGIFDTSVVGFTMKVANVSAYVNSYGFSEYAAFIFSV